MKFSLLKNLVAKCLLFILILTPSACIIVPLKWDNPASDKIDQLEAKKMNQQEVHELLGEPLFSIEKCNVEIYRIPGGANKFMVILPPEGLVGDQITGYIMILYADGYVIDFDYGSDQWDLVLNVEGFEYLIPEETLLATPDYIEMNRLIEEKCSVYFLSYTNVEQSLYVDEKYVGEGIKNKGYLLTFVNSGNHIANLKYRDYDRKVYSDGLNFTCYEGEKIYLKMIDDDPNWFKEKFIFSQSKEVPEDFQKRRLIIFQNRKSSNNTPELFPK